MNSKMIELTITAQKVAESLEIGRSTLNKYSRSLENAGYTYIKDERGNRAYTERDIIALRHAITLLSKGVHYEKAMTDTSLKYGRFPASDGVAMGDTDSEENAVSTENFKDSIATRDAFKQELATEIAAYIHTATESLRGENQELRSILKETLYRLDDMAKQNRHLAEMMAAAALPSPSEQRAEQLNTRLTERRIERQLEREALEQWGAKPESEKVRRVGLFRKEEDREARDRYVKEYIDSHYAQRLKDEFGL